MKMNYTLHISVDLQQKLRDFVGFHQFHSINAIALMFIDLGFLLIISSADSRVKSSLLDNIRLKSPSVIIPTILLFSVTAVTPSVFQKFQ